VAAPMFANTIAVGPPCKPCAQAGRRLDFPGLRSPIRTQILAAAGGTWTACPVCDQPATDAPTWRCT
jgi:hypothetical protein